MVEALKELNDLGWFFVILSVIIVAFVIVGGFKLWKDLKNSLGLKSISELEKEQTKKDIEELKKQICELDEKTNKKISSVQEELHDYQKSHNDDCVAWRSQSVEIRDTFINSVAEMTKVLNEMKSDALEEKIERMRWRILDFASQIRNGRISHPEQFNNVLRTYDDYEILLKKHNLTNGQVDESIKFIREKYHEMLERK